MLDMIVINSWILYRRKNETTNETKCIAQREFRIQLEETLCKMGTSLTPKREHLSSADVNWSRKRKRRVVPQWLLRK